MHAVAKTGYARNKDRSKKAGTSNHFVMPRGSSQKREQEYKKIEQKFEKEGRYKGREEEVAARIVNKQRAQAGETKKRPSTKKKKSKKRS
jgi:hypothetical protein